MKIRVGLVMLMLALVIGAGGGIAQEDGQNEDDNTLAFFHQRAVDLVESINLNPDGDEPEFHLNRPGEEYVYTIDLAQLMLYFALRGWLPEVAAADQPYLKLRDLVLDKVYINDDEKLFSQGFVAWRYPTDRAIPLDASGTTEALRMAQALYVGYGTFHTHTTVVSRDMELVAHILEGYSRHAGILNDTWMIRNYFNLGTEALSTNTYLVDYHPDFLSEFALAYDEYDFRLREVSVQSAEWCDYHQNVPIPDADTYEALPIDEVIIQSYCLYRRSKSPSNLMYDIIQPEVETILPNLELTAFSPNDIVAIANSCTITETAVIGLPYLAEHTLDFALAHMTSEAGLQKYYIGRTGEPLPDSNTPAGLVEYNCLLRLATRLGSEDAQEKLEVSARSAWDEFKDDWESGALENDAGRYFSLSETLLTLHCITNEEGCGY